MLEVGVVRFLFIFTITLPITACTGEYLLHRGGCKNGQVRNGSVCEYPTTDAKGAAGCKDPDLSDLREGKTVTLCDGTTGTGTLKLTSELPSCSKDGEQDCVAKAKFKVVDTSTLTASDIKNGKTIAGISGTKRDIKQCRNASNLSYFDTSPAVNSIKIPSHITSAPGGNAVQLAWNHGLSLNDPIQLYCIGGTPTVLGGGAVFPSTVYYAAIVSANRIQFQATPSGGALSVTSTGGCGVGTWVVGPPSDGIANNEDTIDDYNGLTASTAAPSSSPWGVDYLCNESNFVNVSGVAPLAPSNTTPTNASQSWSQIWEDQASGLYVTNILYDGLPNNRDWYQLTAMCKGLDSLNGGSGGTGWRLPTQKELMQLYVSGISKVSLVGGTMNNHFWSSSGVSDAIYVAWNVYLSYGYTGSNFRNATDRSALCVR